MAKEAQLLDHVATIMVTTEYDIFKFDPTQRPPDPRWVDTLAKEIQKNNLLEDWPITVNRDFVILDGQHRLLAAKKLGVPIYFKFASKMQPEDVPAANSSTRSWRYSDYLHSFAAKGVESYLMLKKFMEIWPFSLEISRMLLTAGQIEKSDTDFKTGKFKIKDYNFAVKMAKHLIEISKYTDQVNRRFFVLALIYMSRNPAYDYKRMVKKISYQTAYITSQVDTYSYGIMLERIYNYRASKKDVVEFTWRRIKK